MRRETEQWLVNHDFIEKVGGEYQVQMWAHMAWCEWCTTVIVRAMNSHEQP